MINIEIPDRIALALNLPEKHRQQTLQKLLAVKLYENGVLGIGKARELARVSKLGFLALLQEENVPMNFDEEELKEDLEHIKEAGESG
jgi:predicted HTH domain antitoxin